MKKVIRVKLLKDPGAEGGFCMSVGSIVELYDGGFRNPEVNASYYPVFGPYTQIEKLADQILAGTNPKAADLFEAVDVSEHIQPTLLHDIMDEAGGIKVCTINHTSLMKLLRDNLITRYRHSEVTDVFRVSNTIFQDDIVAHNIEAIA